MLTDLFLTNIAIIDRLQVNFQQGLNVLTGETGAGKSIIVDGVNLLLGGRASTDLIRTDTDEATVEAQFDLSLSPLARERLAEIGIPGGDELLVKRVLSRNGKNRAFMNGSPATLAMLADITRQLINIYGQHESQILLRPDHHLDLLDSFAGISETLQQYRDLYTQWTTAGDELSHLEKSERETARRIDLLSFQSDEIGKAALKPGELDELRQQRQMLLHSEKLLHASMGGYERLYANDHALLGELRGVRQELHEATLYDAFLVPVVESLDACYATLEDTALLLRGYASRVEPDPDRILQIDERLHLISRLQKKYGEEIETICAFKQEIDRELALLADRDGTLAELRSRRAQLLERLLILGERLTDRRRSAAEELGSALALELAELAMPHASVSVRFTPLTEPGPTGLDRAEFYFAPNPGEEPKPLARIASGGELSRIMLALKQVLPEMSVPTLVFDEVDAGIGGATSALVGQKLQKTAQAQQVLCITHLPQVAACADHHYRVEKQIDAERTVSSIACLTDEQRETEIARMLGGKSITATTRAHARELLQQGRRD